ncbi:MAG: hypothetical protein QME96_14360, partial [Myxococcota bacterium]|nr:hypothetical protein [Myxococcota bacterium]
GGPGGGEAPGAEQPPGAADDGPFVAVGDDVLVSFSRDDPKALVSLEAWVGGRLAAMASVPRVSAPRPFPGFRPNAGLAFIQARGRGKEDAIGRHVLVGHGRGPAPDALRALMNAVRWGREEAAWLRELRARIGSSAPAAAARAAAYLFGRLDGVSYETRTLFDSGPGDRRRADDIRDGIQTTMAWGIVLVGGLFLAAAAIVAAATVQSHRRARKLRGARVDPASAGPEEPSVRVYDEASWLEQHAVPLKGFVGLVVIVAALVALAILVYGMKSIYLLP